MVGKFWCSPEVLLDSTVLRMSEMDTWAQQEHCLLFLGQQMPWTPSSLVFLLTRGSMLFESAAKYFPSEAKGCCIFPSGEFTLAVFLYYYKGPCCGLNGSRETVSLGHKCLASDK